MKRSRYSPISASMICSSRAVPSVLDDQRLRLAAREQRRAVGARQHAGADGDRAHGARVAAVDARLAGQDLLADDLRFEVEQHVADRARVRRATRSSGSAFARWRSCRFPSAAAGAPASGASGTRRAGRLRRTSVTLAISASSLAGGCQSHSGLPPSSTSEWMSSMTACCCWWPNTTAPSITSSGSSCASDSTISTAASVPATTRSSCDVVELGLGRVEDVLAVEVADARGADRARERDAGQRHRGGRADHRRNVGIDLRIHRHHGGDDLHVVVEAVRKQRTQRTVDQAARQRLLLRRTAFALEEAAGDLARGVRLLLVVDGQRKEVLPGLGRLGGHARDEHDGVAEARQHGASGLAGDLAGFERQRVVAVLNRFLDVLETLFGVP